jgi:hypothetical protein
MESGEQEADGAGGAALVLDLAERLAVLGRVGGGGLVAGLVGRFGGGVVVGLLDPFGELRVEGEQDGPVGADVDFERTSSPSGRVDSSRVMT